jgi:hypothetical protein
MPSHPNPYVYAEHWPKIAVTLDYRGGLSYWAVTVELGGMVRPGEADAFAAALKAAEAACVVLNSDMVERGRGAERDERKVIGVEPQYLGERR